MSDLGADSVVVQRRDLTMIVTINRPEVRNCVDAGVSRSIGDALDEAERDPRIRVVVLTGAGDQAFCAGADLKALARGESVVPPGRQDWGFAGFVSHPVSKPTIAAVNGFALGGGTELVLASDLAVAADTARFGLPEVKRGIMAAAGGAFRLATQLPSKVAMELLLTGNDIDAATALRLGLVNRVVARDRVLEEALTLAEVIAANAPLAVQATKRVAIGIRQGRVPHEDDAWQLNQVESRAVKASRDAREGPRAFAEKRMPHWQGR